MRVLFLSQRVPFPPNRGDKITTWRLIERMRREHEVTVITFAHDEADLAAAQELNARGIPTVAVPFNEKKKKALALPLLLTRRPLTLGVYGSRQLQREVDRRLPQTDVAYAYSSSMGAFLVGKGTPWIMHFAELDSDKWRQYAEKQRFPMSAVYRREWRTLQAFEARIARDARQNIFCTPLEQAIFEETIPGCPSAVLRNGVDLKHLVPAPERAEPGHIAFCGVMDYFPNVDGCEWFARELLPKVRERVPAAHFTIVGSRPVPEVQRLAELEGVEVTGFVDDPRDWLWRAAVSVAPLRIARGIQNKVLEALALGLPVVGTTPATQGVAGEPGRDFLLADDGDAFARAVIELLEAPERALELGRRGRSFVEERYDWEATFEPLDQILREAAGGRHATPSTT